MDSGFEEEQEFTSSGEQEQGVPHGAFDMDALLSHWNVILIIAVWAGIQTIRRVLPNEWFDKGRPLARLLPLASTVLCNIAVWVPGPWMDPDYTAGQRIALGTVLGFATANIHTIAARLGLHQLLRVEADTRKLPSRKQATSPASELADTDPDGPPQP